MNSNCLIALHGSFFSDYLKMPKSYSIFLNIKILHAHIEIKTIKMS